VDETTMTRAERSLLLFLETQAVDYGGKVRSASMSDEDFEIARRWAEEGFIEFGRRPARAIMRPGVKRFHWVRLSDRAWDLAHRLRKLRGLRNLYDKEEDHERAGLAESTNEQ